MGSAAGQVVAGGGRGPHKQAAEGEQRGDGEQEDPVESGRPQRGDRPDAVPGSAGPAHGRFLAGGMIEPSLLNVGRPFGGVVPGIAARSGSMVSSPGSMP